MTTRAILPGLSDRQVERLVELARPLEISKREVFLERLGFLLRGCGPDLFRCPIRVGVAARDAAADANEAGGVKD